MTFTKVWRENAENTNLPENWIGPEELARAQTQLDEFGTAEQLLADGWLPQVDEAIDDRVQPAQYLQISKLITTLRMLNFANLLFGSRFAPVECGNNVDGLVLPRGRHHFGLLEHRVRRHLLLERDHFVGKISKLRDFFQFSSLNFKISKFRSPTFRTLSFFFFFFSSNSFLPIFAALFKWNDSKNG